MLLPLVNQRENAIVWSYEILILSGDQQWATGRTNSRIYDHDVNCSWRKIGVCRTDGESSVKQVIGIHVVSDIDDGEFRVDLKQNAFERADQMIVGAVVGGQGNDWISHCFSRSVL